MTQEIRVGDKIKSYDFPDNKNCYMTGEVVEIDEDYIYCKTTSRVFSGNVIEHFNPTFRTPKQGLCTFDREDDPRIVKIAVEDVVKPEPAPVRIKIIECSDFRFKFPYGQIHGANAQFLKDFLGEEFTAVRANMNYYRLKNGYLVHIYNTSVVG